MIDFCFCYPPVLCLLDFTNNRFDRIPQEVCDFMQLVKLSFYRNLLRSVSEDLRHLENLKDLNLRYNNTTCTLREKERGKMVVYSSWNEATC